MFLQTGPLWEYAATAKSEYGLTRFITKVLDLVNQILQLVHKAHKLELRYMISSFLR
jgi:hypothetical protein